MSDEILDARLKGQAWAASNIDSPFCECCGSGIEPDWELIAEEVDKIKHNKPEKYFKAWLWGMMQESGLDQPDLRIHDISC